MKKLLPFILFACISTQTKLCAQQSNSANSIAINTKVVLVSFTQPVTESAVSIDAAAKVPGKVPVKKTAKKISSFFSKISKQITKGYEQLAAENTSTAVVISKASIPTPGN